jgi:hypothetical protein
VRDDELRARALALIQGRPRAAGDGIVGWLTRLCQVLSVEAGVTAVTVTVGPPNDSSAVVAASDPAHQRFAESEFGAGEGPAQEAWTHGRPVLVPELGGSQDGAWPGYAMIASAAGVRAVFAFPLQMGAVRFGVLTLFRDQPGPLSRPELRMCLSMAVLATERLINDSTLPGGDLDPSLQEPLDFRNVVYQAQGIVAVALGITLIDALARMRGHAFRSGRGLVEIADDIVHNGLRLVDDKHNRDTGTNQHEAE